MQRIVSVAAVTLSTSLVALAARLTPPYFPGAAAANAVPFAVVSLPQPEPPSLIGDLPLVPAFTGRSPFAPTLHQLLEGNTVITTEKEMREVWARLFRVPYDASQLDFASSFVVLMGGGSIPYGSFDITAVEQVEASYSNPGGVGSDPATETFLSVTATTFLSGVPAGPPPTDSWRVSAVRIPRALLDDVVFRRNVIDGI